MDEPETPTTTDEAVEAIALGFLLLIGRQNDPRYIIPKLADKINELVPNPDRRRIFNKFVLTVFVGTL